MKGKDPLDLEVRRRIFRLVEAEPGLHLREIQRRLGLAMGELEYQLGYLERREILVVRRDGHFARYYPMGRQGQWEKSVLFLVRQRRIRHVLVHLLLHPGSRPSDVASGIGISAATVTYYVRRLAAAGLVSVVEEGREKRLFVVDPERVAGMLIKYRSSFLDDVVDRFARTWLEL